MDDQDKALNPEGETETTPDTTPVSEETTTDESISEEEPQGGQMPYTQPPEPLVKPGEEVTVEELDRRQREREQSLLQQAVQINSLQTQRALAIDRVNREARELTRKYDVLNPRSENFDPELSEAVTEAAEAYVRANPTKSLEEFVDKQMRLHKRAITKEAKAEQAEIAKQSGQSAIRPSTSKPVEKKFEDKTIEEMESELGFAKG